MAGNKSSNRKPDVWVSPRPDGKWEVQREGSQKPSRVTDTQHDAWEIGRGYAQADQVDLIVQGRDGRIQSHDSYGNDPCPPKDTEH